MKTNPPYRMRNNAPVVVAFLLLGLPLAAPIQAQDASTTPAANAAAATNTAPTATETSASYAVKTTKGDSLREAYRLFLKNDLDGSMDKVDAVIKLEPQNKSALLLRGSIYAQEKEWDRATADYEAVHELDPTSIVVKFDQAELKFMQKKYDDARPGFVELQADKDLGDFATYKVFLCDLFAPHEDVAAKELDAFNKVGGNPSYYYSNAAWDLVHNKTSDASDWLSSAGRIYANAPDKIANYTASLHSLGYLPVHPATTP